MAWTFLSVRPTVMSTDDSTNSKYSIFCVGTTIDFFGWTWKPRDMNNWTAGNAFLKHDKYRQCITSRRYSLHTRFHIVFSNRRRRVLEPLYSLGFCLKVGRFASAHSHLWYYQQQARLQHCSHSLHVVIYTWFYSFCNWLHDVSFEFCKHAAHQGLNFLA